MTTDEIPESKSSPSSSSQDPNPNPDPDPKRLKTDSGDRLSALPDPILHHVLSLLRTDEMVRTSALSRRWARLWTFSPVFHFTGNFASDSIELKDHPSIVDRCLSQCTDASHSLASVCFPLVKSPEFTFTADRWIRFAAARSVEHLTFSPISAERLSVRMPPSLFDCHRLKTLNLSCCFFSAIPSGFRFLTTISFTHGSIGDDQLGVLLSGCPMIKSLRLGYIAEITRIVIQSPTLRHLAVFQCNRLAVLEIAMAPELRRLMYCGDLSNVRTFEGSMPKLEEAFLLSFTKVPFETYEIFLEFIGSIVHVKILSVSSWFLQEVCVSY